MRVTPLFNNIIIIIYRTFKECKILRQEGFSMKYNAEKVGVKKYTVHLTIRLFQKRGNLKNFKRPRPCRVTSAAEGKRIKLIDKRYRGLQPPKRVHQKRRPC
jgi:hypothetical protein